MHVPLLDPDDQAELRDEELTAAWEPVLWAFCAPCRRWRLVPPSVYLAVRKRGQKFTCKTIHPAKGCQQPLKPGERNWSIA